MRPLTLVNLIYGLVGIFAGVAMALALVLATGPSSTIICPSFLTEGIVIEVTYAEFVPERTDEDFEFAEECNIILAPISTPVPSAPEGGGA